MLSNLGSFYIPDTESGWMQSPSFDNYVFPYLSYEEPMHHVTPSSSRKFALNRAIYFSFGGNWNFTVSQDQCNIFLTAWKTMQSEKLILHCGLPSDDIFKFLHTLGGFVWESSWK